MCLFCRVFFLSLCFAACGPQPPTSNLYDSESPEDFTVVSFHPSRPDLLFAGQINGKATLRRVGETSQTILWTQEHSASVRSMAISADGALVAVGWNDGALAIFSALSGEVRSEIQRQRFPDAYTALAFSADRRVLAASATGFAVDIWDLSTGTLRRSIETDIGGTNIVGISQDGATVFSSGLSAIGVWSIANGMPLATYRDPASHGDIFSDPEGFLRSMIFNTRFAQSLRIAALAMNSGMTILDTQTGAVVARLDEGHIFSKAAFADEGRTVLGFDPSGIAFKWSLMPEPRIVASYEVANWSRPNGDGTTTTHLPLGETPIDFSADGNLIAFVENAATPKTLRVAALRSE